MAIKNGQTSSAADFTGMLWPTILRSWDTTIWLLCNGQAVSRSTYSALFALVCPSATVTVTITTPGVMTWTSNALANGDAIVLSTTGALPTGLTAGVIYYVIGLSGNTFNLAQTYGGSAIATSGSQSGTHTARCVTFGNGDGSTTFNVPDLRGRKIIGAGTGTKVATILSIAGNVFTATGLQGNSNEFQTGEAVVFNAGTAGNLSNGNTYYLRRVTNTTFALATTLARAQANTSSNDITLAGTETGSFTLTLSTRAMGDTGGEEAHAMSITEILAHFHTFLGGNNTSGGVGGQTGTGNNAPTTTVGGNAAMNTEDPFLALNYLIHV